VVAEVLCRDEACGTGRTAAPSEFAVDEVRAALMLTRRGADAVCGLAFDLVVRLPAVHAAMWAGVLDEPRARVFCDWTAGLSRAQARAVCAVLLRSAPGWTTGQLAEQIKRVAVAVDPGWARRRYETAVRGRRVVGSRNPDGSANLAGYDLPVDRVAAACARIDRLAKAAKRAGRLEPIDQLRADLFLGLTDGRYAGLDDAAIPAALLASVADPADPAGPAGSTNRPGSAGPGPEVRVQLTHPAGPRRAPRRAGRLGTHPRQPGPRPGRRLGRRGVDGGSPTGPATRPGPARCAAARPARRAPAAPAR
jgi:hypothetical protein